MRRAEHLALLSIAALGLAGCANKQIVRAEPPSVITPPPAETSTVPPPVEPPTVEITAEPLPATPAPAPAPAPAKRATPRPRPAPTETTEPAEPTTPKPAPPQISPQLSPRDLEATKARTTTNITTAEKNLQQASGRQLNAAQKDLSDKISGFLGQAHEAILADDWVRALNLAEKARVLSAELVKSF